MGYLLTIEPRSDKLRQRMLDFMDEHFVPAHEMFERVVEEHDVTAEGVLTEWTYGTDEGQIGFYYHAGAQNLCTNYSQMIVRWMALKIGKRKVFGEHGISDPVPYTWSECTDYQPLYDESKYGDELKTKLASDHFLHWRMCDTLGFHAPGTYFFRDEGYLDFDDPRIEEINETIKSEVERLDELWETS